jgi:hypothetical protein
MVSELLGFTICPGVYFLIHLQHNNGRRQSGKQQSKNKSHQGLNQLFFGSGWGTVARTGGGGNACFGGSVMLT